MGLITSVLGIIFGSGSNAVRDTVEVFRKNAEQDASRDQELRLESLKQYAREFEMKQDGLFNRIMDGVNRLPRPALALGTLGLFLAAMIDPIWFSARMQGIALVPEPLWWLLGVIVSFYFGARHQVKTQEFQRSIANTMAHAPTVAKNIRTLQALRPGRPGVASTGSDADLEQGTVIPEANPALEDWKKTAKPAATK